MLDGITLSIMTDLKLVFLFTVDRVSHMLEKQCEELTVSILNLVESKQVSSLREIWSRIVNEILSQADLVLTIDRIRLSSSDEHSHSDSVKCFSISTGETGVRDLYIKFIKGSNTWIPMIKQPSDKMIRSPSKNSVKKSILSKSKEFAYETPDEETNLYKSRLLGVEGSGQKKTRFSEN